MVFMRIFSIEGLGRMVEDGEIQLEKIPIANRGENVEVIGVGVSQLQQSVSASTVLVDGLTSDGVNDMQSVGRRCRSTREKDGPIATSRRHRDRGAARRTTE